MAAGRDSCSIAGPATVVLRWLADETSTTIFFARCSAAIARLTGTLGSADTPTVELVRESGIRAVAEERRVPHYRLCRRHRLSRRTRSGQERSPCAGARISLGRYTRARTDVRGQEFRGLRLGAKGVPRRLLSPLVPSSLFRDLAMARADGSLRSLLTQLSGIEVLVIDDWAMAPLSEPERRDIWEICEDRYQVRSTILTSQLPVSRWHEQIGDPTLADGILDRLVHNAHRIEMKGDSMRKNRTGARSG